MFCLLSLLSVSFLVYFSQSLLLCLSPSLLSFPRSLLPQFSLLSFSCFSPLPLLSVYFPVTLSISSLSFSLCLFTLSLLVDLPSPSLSVYFPSLSISLCLFPLSLLQSARYV
jgi:hypothetical protein